MLGGKNTQENTTQENTTKNNLPVLFSLLPIEIVKLILSYLKPRDLADSTANAKNKSSNKYADSSPKSQQLIHRYLFSQQFDALKLEFKLETPEFEYQALLPLMLDAVLGDIKKIDSAKRRNCIKQNLYSIAVGNGHFGALDKLEEKLRIGAVFTTAATLGNVEVLKKLINQDRQRLLANGYTIMIAAGNRNFDFVIEMLTMLPENESFNPIYLDNVLLNATIANKPEVVENILNLAGAAITPAGKSTALNRAAHLGHLPMVQLLIARCGGEISLQDKYKAVQKAAIKGHLKVAQHIVNSKTKPSQEDVGLSPAVVFAPNLQRLRISQENVPPTNNDEAQSKSVFEFR